MMGRGGVGRGVVRGWGGRWVCVEGGLWRGRGLGVAIGVGHRKEGEGIGMDGD